MGAYTLDEAEGFRAMVLFVNQFAARPGNDIGILLGDIELDSWGDGGPYDPAAWTDWLDCVRQVKETTPL